MQDKLELEPSEELAYLLGALRDGYIHVKKKPSYYSHYTLEFCSSSKEWLESLATIIQKLTGKLGKVRQFRLEKGHWRLKFDEKEFVLKLLKISEFQAPQYFWKTPSVILTSDDELKRYYMSGFFDAEGGIYLRTPQWEVAFYQSWSIRESCPPLEDIKEILESFGIHTTKIISRDKGRKHPLFSLRITDKTSIKKFCKIATSLHPKKSAIIEKVRMS